jgi:predicted nucleic acid-binding protein
MILIVDTNIIFAGLLRNSTSRELLMDPNLQLYTPETGISEIRKYENEIIKRAALEKEEFEALFTLITTNITVIEKEAYHKQMKEAEKLIGKRDPGDVPFLALALAIPNNGIWTQNVKHFSGQEKVNILTTKDVLEKVV